MTNYKNLDEDWNNLDNEIKNAYISKSKQINLFIKYKKIISSFRLYMMKK